jgi:hypothetical protein
MPLEDAVPSPLRRLREPPVFNVLRPAVAVRIPPAPLVPLPTVSTTEPPLPFVAAPEPIHKEPLSPLLALPELNINAPLAPVAPAFKLRMDKIPLLEEVPSPVDKLSAPPVLTTLRPAST